MVMDILAYPAVPGLFMSGIFSGAVSSISSSLSSLAAITWEDFLKPYLGKRLTEFRTTVILKIIVVVYGLLAFAMSFAMTFIEGTLIQAVVSLMFPINGAVGGMFILGAFFPFANKYGAFVGGVTGLVISIWRSLGAYNRGIEYLLLPYPNGTCTGSNSSLIELSTTPQSNVTTPQIPDKESGPFDEFYRLSYVWSPALSALACCVPGILISLATRRYMTEEEKEVPTMYQIPIFTRLFCCLPNSWLYWLDCSRSFESPEAISHRMKDNELFVPSSKEGNRCDMVGFGKSSDVENREMHKSDNGVLNSAFVKDELPGDKL
ncbi:sodium-coupled monocarboxylate transporter 1 [Elysia marginata]|uniref:Sodium-coupled monocarboxylate transporter 1 n=1 Tax=Elysia marginata TaxID=1093978 RepID=A0AAV4GIK2_9GAST|nr:sodium-coupled monocarboxylate transporter 1 [Elysia marginata]